MDKEQTAKNLLLGTKLLVSVFVLLFSLPSTHALANNLVGQESRIVELTNQVRQRTGASALTQDSRLMESALNKAQDMAEKGYFSHINSDKQRMFYWMNNTGYEYSLAGENLAKGFSSADRLVRAWEKSFSHYINLVEPKFKNIGIGIAVGNLNGKETVFVVQHLGVEKSVSRNIGGFTDFTSPITQFISGTRSIESTLGDIEKITDGSIFAKQTEHISTGGQETATKNDNLNVLLAVIALAGIGYIVNYTNANKLSRRLLLKDSLNK